MCLYEQKMLNPHYLPNEKNGGVPTLPSDSRLKYIKVGCGWCKECRQQIASNWRIRLTEELVEHKEAQYVTFTFSPESIEQLEKEIHKTRYRGIEGEDTEANILAAFAIRRWSERWRKRFARAPRHFLITELGHVGSERIHLHGIVFEINARREAIVETWKYGSVVLGQWVDERTINYIVKYITKNDSDHSGYKPRTFVSKGLGKGYIDRVGNYVNKWRDKETNTKYKGRNGQEIELPRYYKTKLYTDEQREQLMIREIEKGMTYLNGSEWDVQRSDEETQRNNWKSALNAVRETNKRAGYSDNRQQQFRYIITEAMKKKGETTADPEVQRQRKREIKSEKEYNEVEEIAKTWGVKETRLGKYIGTTTEGERKKNEEMTTAEEMGISVRQLRLIRKGVIKM